MDKFSQLIDYARQNNCSDLHITCDLGPVFRKNGELFESNFKMSTQQNFDLIRSLLTQNQIETLEQGFDIDFCYTSVDGFRQRVNVYKQQNQYCAAIRILNDKIPSFEELKFPPIIKNLASQTNGLILVTGATGSGKSTTLASMIDYINETRSCHILTIEDPIEYVYKHKKSMIHQRQVGTDTKSFSEALRSALREDPDVILVGEMRDLETISAAITAAETGHLVLSTLHTNGAANAIDRIINAFDLHSQQQIRVQLSTILKGVISQVLVPLSDLSDRIAALEILIGTDAVSNLIRTDKCHQLKSVMQTGMNDGMNTLNLYLANLVKQNKITYEKGLEASNDKNEYKQYFL
jgi:pilus retraction protein PilT